MGHVAYLVGPKRIADSCTVDERGAWSLKAPRSGWFQVRVLYSDDAEPRFESAHKATRLAEGDIVAHHPETESP
jgi:hypothetical protein